MDGEDLRRHLHSLMDYILDEADCFDLHERVGTRISGERHGCIVRELTGKNALLIRYQEPTKKAAI